MSRGAVSKDWVDEMNAKGAGYELGCDWSNMFSMTTTTCFCEESKCNGAGSSTGSLLMALVLSVGAMYMAKF